MGGVHVQPSKKRHRHSGELMRRSPRVGMLYMVIGRSSHSRAQAKVNRRCFRSSIMGIDNLLGVSNVIAIVGLEDGS